MKKKILKSLIVVLVLALACIYALPACSQLDNSGDVVTDNASFHFDEEEILRQLKEKNIDAINKDLIKRVDEQKLTGSVNVIVTLSEGSLVNTYNQSDKKQTLGQYLADGEARTLAAKAEARQQKLEKELVDEGLIAPAKYRYSNILDGFSATTTYENLAELIKHEGVYRVIIGNTYLPQATVVNDVNVFDTGIFNSENSADYTGKHTVVAILDTGCDYAHPAFTTHQVIDPRYTRSDIERILANNDLKAEQDAGGSLEAREVYFGNLTKEKIVFGYDYADKDTDIMPFLSEHGTHVAGIIGGYAEEAIFDKNEHFDGDKSTSLHGVAIDTQFAIMKVFSDSRTGAEDEDILAALEDCVALEVDAINMSLGSSCGFTREADEDAKSDIYDSIEEAGISLIVAASNDYSAAQGSEFGNTNKVENPDSGTVGAPSTYTSAFSVASVNGNNDKFLRADDRDIFFIEAYDQNSEEYNFFEKLGVTDDQNHEFEYVTVPGVGSQVNYMGLDVHGKIALVKRGDINFEDKVLFASAAGAVGVIIYNNVYGDILMTVGNNCPIGVVSIGKDEGEYLASKPSGTLVLNAKDTAGPFMSDFSSWGPNPDLTIKPEITAHGGNIWSAIPGGGYEKMSGTSMASPNMCGIAVLVREYVNDKFPDESVTTKRDIVNRLLMSTATIAVNKEGNPYSPRKQGAGIADILAAISTNAYIVTYKNDLKEHKLLTDSQGNKIEMSTSKLELGDDPERTGEYTMTFTVRNISDKVLTYKLGNYTFTESVSADKKYVAEMAYMLSHNVQYQVNGAAAAGDMVTVPAKGSADVTVKITLSKQDRTYLNDTFPNGMYVEGFITLDNQDASEDIDLNVPFLAFYGDWEDAPIFDKDYYEVETTAHNNAIDDEDKIKADYVATTPYALYYYDYIIPMGTYLYDLPYGYTPIPATEEHAALSYQPTSLSGLYAVYAGLLRGAKKMDMEIVNASTGEVVWSKEEWNCYKAHFNGSPMPHVLEFEEFGLPMFDLSSRGDLTIDTTGAIDGAFGYNNEKFIVTLRAHLDWGDLSDRNISDEYSFSFYIDTEAPTVVGSSFTTKYNKNTKKTEYYLELEVYDNHYAMGVRPIVIDWSYDENGNHIISDRTGEPEIAIEGLSDNAFPVYQSARGTTTTVEIEITDYMDRVHDSLLPNTILIQVDDYALNTNFVAIPLPESDNEDLVFGEYVKGADGSTETLEARSTLDLDIGQTFDLTQYVVGNTPEINSNINRDYLFMLDWSTADTEHKVITMHNGIVEGLAEGSTTVSFKAGDKVQTVTVNVSGQQYTGANTTPNGDTAPLEEIKFTSYHTLRAFNSDIDFSDIGESGSHNYFGSSAAISFYPSEKVKLHYSIKPWNLEENPERYTLTWNSTDPNIAKVDDEGNVVAIKEGNCSITLSINIDGRPSPLQARCSIEVKSEFVIESRYLIAYKGMGKDYNGEDPSELVAQGKPIVVEVPDDEGLMYINSFAFSYFNLDNDREVDDPYDLDAKKDPIGNDWISEVILPDYITNIENYAFYGCTNLRKVTLGEKLTQIGKYAFYKCSSLESINLDNVNMINDYAFYGCSKLRDLGENKLAHPYALGVSAFEGCKSITQLELTNLRRGGVRTFKGCESLTNVTFGEFTRLSESMFEGCKELKHTKMFPMLVQSDVVPDRAFYGCLNLVAVEFAKDITYFGKDAFSGCKGLLNVKFDGQCEEFAANAFSDCSSIESFEIGGFKAENGVVYNTDQTELLYVVPSLFKQTDFTLPATVKTIGPGAFSGTNITSFNVADGSALSTIGNNAFAGCTSLSNVTLPDTVTSIGSGVFANSGLTSIDLSGLNISAIPAEMFSGSRISTVTLPENCTSIGDRAFESCTALTSVNGLDSVKYIGNSAFSMSGLVTVTLGDGVTIDSYAFAGATSASPLATVNFGSNTTIGERAFYNTSLTQLTISGSGSTIGNYAFANCARLTTADIDGVEGKLGDGAFYQCVQYVASSQGISGGLTTVYMNNVTELGTSAFEGNPTLTTVHSASLTKIGDMAFYPYVIDNGAFYNRLASIDTGNVTEIGDDAFLLCTSLDGIDLSNVRKIGARAFDTCSILTTVNAENLEEIGKGAFMDCSRLTTIVAPRIKRLGSQAFFGTSIRTMEIGTDIEYVGDGVTFGANSFEGFTVQGESSHKDATSNFILDKGALYIKNPLGYTLVSYPARASASEYTVLEGTTRIGFRAAANSINLRTLILPESLLSIGDYAFYGCNNLSRVVFRSYYAPRLESVANLNEEIRLTPPENVQEEYMTEDDFPYFDELYKYDFYYHFPESGEISYAYGNIFAYRQFVGIVGQKKLAMQIPSNSSGYDNLIYRVFFTEEEQKGDAVMGRYAIDFINAVQTLMKLSKIDRYASKQIDAAIRAYNFLEKSSDIQYVDESYISFYEEAVRQYNVDVVRHAFMNLFDMADTRSSYEDLRNVYELYNSLSAEESMMLDDELGTSAKTLLDNKIAEYKTATDNRKLDFGQTWADRTIDRLHELVGSVVDDFDADQYAKWDSDTRFEYWRSRVQVEDYATLKEIRMWVKTLTDDEYDEYIAKLTPYLDLIDTWNDFANVSRLLSTAQTVAYAPSGNAVVAAVLTVNALLAAAYVALKGGIL